MSSDGLRLDEEVTKFIKESKVAQEILQHLHPDGGTAIIVEDKDSECPLVGIVYGARRKWLNPTRENKEPFDVVIQLHNLHVLQENYFGENRYFALWGEWNYSKDKSIYAQLCPKPDLRKELYNMSGLKADPIYCPDKG